MSLRQLAAGAALTTLAAIGATGARAQSTGTSAVEELVVSARQGPKTIGGIAAISEPKARAAVTQDYIQTQLPGQTVLAVINALPGVNFTGNDAFGSAGGDITIRGFDSQRIALLQDGIPLNDTGNYAIYPNQQLDSELIEQVTVNLGTTDVDSPTAAAAGGTINYTTLKPARDFGGYVKISGGSENYKRVFGLLNSGAFGPWGTTAWLSAGYARNDIFSGPGKIEKVQVNGRLYQALTNGDFLSLIFDYDQNRNAFIRRISLAQFKANQIVGYDPGCSLPAHTSPGPGAQADVNCSNFFANNINPSNTGNIRGQSSFHLRDNLRLTFDPYFQYTLANGGGRVLMKETDAQLAAGGRAGTDLNGDGDLLDSVLEYWPNTTQTHRYGLTSSLIWEINTRSNVRVAYTYDIGRHRQTGDAGVFDANGFPQDVFGGKNGYGSKVVLADGSTLRKRDRYSIAALNQLAAEYRGRFFADHLLLNAGLRAPYFHRELNNYCYQRDTFNAYCTTQTPAGPNAQGLYTFPVSVNAPAGSLFGPPRKFERNYQKVLPNVAAGWDFSSVHHLYAAYAETISAPRTDDLYDQQLVNPRPETTQTVSVGYRFQTTTLDADVGVFQTKFDNRISRTFDEASQVFNSVNVGRVDYQGADGAVQWRPLAALTLTSSASYIKTEIKNNLANGVVAGVPVFLLTKGKRVPEIPQFQAAVGGEYKLGAATFGLQGKFVGKRWTNEVNTEQAPSYTLWNANLSYDLDGVGLKGSQIQLNVSNLLDEKWLGDITTNPTGTALFQPGYPRAVTLTLKGAF